MFQLENKIINFVSIAYFTASLLIHNLSRTKTYQNVHYKIKIEKHIKYEANDVNFVNTVRPFQLDLPIMQF